jgi:response regulator RpfG family c-di-GMP phosphodiesterase
MSTVAPPRAPREHKPRVLCVDDEVQVLEGLKDTLRRSFDVRVAASGAEGLELLRREPESFSVVISDMRMPVLPGWAFLREVRRIAPDAARILLTGYSDVDSAARAVNDGQLFRFLTKPCGHDELMRACAAGLGHHRVSSAERVLLEETLRGSVQALSDVLALASPLAFGRCNRVKPVLARFADAIRMDDRWELEVAAMLAPIGAVTLPDEVAEKLYAGRPLTEDEEAMVARLPEVTRGILGHIPRLDGVLRILDDVYLPFDQETQDRLPGTAARLLRIVFDHDVLESVGMSTQAALDTMRDRTGAYDPALLETFARLRGAADRVGIRDIGLDELRPGMVLLQDVRSTSDVLLISRGQTATPELLVRLRNFPDGYVREPMRVDARGVSS